ncbi:hypothetical protein IEQ34_020483 [Dendrobium chrysotoxum]|uniref:Uncharacterized protein n=1 Tax=Dendrobium chrysotoxum TaxID=161865 RepID=A0AAV7G0A2_DENCH|nr:hypothetical protein IEQ34_020483 [Dendrobium chrysotoxum]
MKDLPVPLYVGEEDILRILNIPDVNHLLFEVHYLTKYIEEEFLFKTIIQDHLQEACEHIYDVEVKALERQCMDEGFTRGFLKGVRLAQCKAGVKIDGITISQDFEDPSSNLDGAEIESKPRQAFSSDDESIDVK